jgi:hypothetical protein
VGQRDVLKSFVIFFRGSSLSKSISHLFTCLLEVARLSISDSFVFEIFVRGRSSGGLLGPAPGDLEHVPSFIS